MVIPVAVLLHNVRSLYNVGAFFRTADAVGVSRLHLSGFTGAPPSKQIAKTALGAEQHVPWERSDPLALIDERRCARWEVAAIETVEGATDVFDWQPRFPVLVVFGHEVDGLPAEIVSRCDTHVRIPMVGTKRSLNVATAGGVVLYELFRKSRHGRSLAREGIGTPRHTARAGHDPGRGCVSAARPDWCTRGARVCPVDC